MSARVVPELLAPAGGWEQLEYAIRFGADAVYLATDKFGMRARACNFALAEIPEVVCYAHERGVTVHVTCNIVMHDEDIDALPAYLQALDAAGVDAILVGDLGAFALVRQHAPHVDIHISTQASVANIEAARMWAQLGATRIVCAREMSLEAIARMRRELDPAVELEVFVHGSMCMAYSGRCLISDYTTGRSALQGECTQPCRWNFSLQEEKRPGQFFPIEEDANGTYLMNAMDLCMLDHIDDLMAAGVDSIKIEGRNKKAYYVATVVNAYRQVLDGAPAAQFDHELQVVSHRPYCTGFFYGPAHQHTQSDEYIRLYDWVADVITCEPTDTGLFRSVVKCRNRFYNLSELEVLSPHMAPCTVTVSQVRHEPDGAGQSYAVDVANRVMETYSFVTATQLHPFDILRSKRVDPDKKN